MEKSKFEPDTKTKKYTPIPKGEQVRVFRIPFNAITINFDATVGKVIAKEGHSYIIKLTDGEVLLKCKRHMFTPTSKPNLRNKEGFKHD